MVRELLSVIIPVYNEAANIETCLERLGGALAELPHEYLICYDFDGDNTLQAIASMENAPPGVRLVKNDLARGAAYAIRSGMAAAEGDVIVTTMADLSDPPEVIPLMARKIRDERADVVSGSRYMRGGAQRGGPRLKTLLSRAAGLSLCWLAGIRTHDPTNNFRAYSRRFIDAVSVESREGFEVGLELTVKAHLGGFKVAQVPSTWVDRSAGESRFRMWRWMPRYLAWYLRALAVPVVIWVVLAAAAAAAFYLAGHYGRDVPWRDEFENLPYVTGEEPVTARWLWRPHESGRIVVPRLAYIAIAKVSGADFRAGMMFNVAAMGGIAFAFIMAARRIRGRMALSDVFFPLAWLHWGHAETMLWSFGTQFTLTAILFSAVVLTVSCFGERLKRAHVILIGSSLVLLALCGAQGLLLTPPIILWLVISGWAGEPDAPHRAGRASLSVAFAVLAVVMGVLCFVEPAGSGPSPSLRRFAAGFAAFPAVSFGPVAEYRRPLLAVLTVILYLLTAGFLLRLGAKQPSQRTRAFGVTAILAAAAVLAAGIAYGRGGAGLRAGAGSGYITVSLPVLCCVYLAYVRYGRRGLCRIAPWLLAAVVLAGLYYNCSKGLAFAEARRRESDLFKRNVAAGFSSEQLARTHRDTLFGGEQEDRFAEKLEMLRRARLGPFRPPGDSRRHEPTQPTQPPANAAP